MRILLALGDGVPSGGTEAVAHALATVASEHELVLTHCYGPPQAHALELSLGNALPERDVVSLLTQVVVAGDDPALGTSGKATPHAIAEIRSLRALLASGALVICAGERRLSVALDRVGRMHGVEVTVDEDLTAALLARRLDADLMAILTEVEPLISTVRAARHFTEATGRRAAIGSLADVAQVVRGAAGTQVQAAAADPAIAARRTRAR